MKVFFYASLRGKDRCGDIFLRVFHCIEKEGYTHVYKDIVSQTFDSYVKEAEEGGKDRGVKMFQKLVNQGVGKSDICVFDVSIPTIGIGFGIRHALEIGKPTIVLYNEDTYEETKSPIFLFGAQDDRLLIKGYTEKNVEKVVKEALAVARERRDKRFNFFISPNLLRYLEDTSKDQKITKSRFIRNLLVEHMREQKEDLVDGEE